MYPMTPEEFELWVSIKRLGGAKKVKELLDSLEKHNVEIDDLLNYLKSVDYKIPNPLEMRITELESRVSILEGKIGEDKVRKPETSDEEIIKKYNEIIKIALWLN